ncbi:NUDIX hydrolase [Enterococcus cecorum]|uniref:NUDIX hydrolase n=1 Tax=Enterococcus cecorum TaxID=44008 RepID=UPI00200B094C|nr:NUDIX hydrolase [Enterococcus cecorum]MDZ5585306.1 NUDIX hydrolase [Enterococcus cecorum]
MENRLIAHSLIKWKNKFLLIKRSDIKRGIKNVYPSYWDIPGGSVEDGELPRHAAIRECREEVGLDIEIKGIIHEDSNIDKEKIFTRLVYNAKIINDKELNIKLDPEEHVQYLWISNLDELKGEKIVPYLYNILN